MERKMTDEQFVARYVFQQRFGSIEKEPDLFPLELSEAQQHKYSEDINRFRDQLANRPNIIRHKLALVQDVYFNTIDLAALEIEEAGYEKRPPQFYQDETIWNKLLNEIFKEYQDLSMNMLQQQQVYVDYHVPGGSSSDPNRGLARRPVFESICTYPRLIQNETLGGSYRFTMELLRRHAHPVPQSRMNNVQSEYYRHFRERFGTPDNIGSAPFFSETLLLLESYLDPGLPKWEYFNDLAKSAFDSLRPQILRGDHYPAPYGSPLQTTCFVVARIKRCFFFFEYYAPFDPYRKHNGLKHHDKMPTGLVPILPSDVTLDLYTNFYSDNGDLDLLGKGLGMGNPDWLHKCFLYCCHRRAPDGMGIIRDPYDHVAL